MPDRLSREAGRVLQLLKQGPLSAENLAATFHMDPDTMAAWLIGLDLNGFVFQSTVSNNWFISQQGLRQIEEYHP